MKAFIKKILFNGFFCFLVTWLFYLFHFGRNSSQNNFSTNDLADFYPHQKTSCIRKKPIVNNHRYNLQIIVPCFNAENFLKKCVDSILNKSTNYSISVILIDDGSTDKTNSICDVYSSIDPRVVVIHQNNKGFSAARNSGLNLLDSDFLMFVDSDDFLYHDFDLNSVLDKAYALNKSERSTIVEFGFIRFRDKKYFGQCMPNKGYMRPSSYKGFAWGKVFPSDLFTNVEFPLNYWFEDTFIKMIVLFLQNIKCFGIHTIGYVYRDNQNSITYTYKKNTKSLDSLYIMESMLDDAHRLNIDFNSKYSSIIMWQIVCTFIRTKNMDDIIAQSIFFKTYELLAEFKIVEPSSIRYRFLYKSIINKRLKSYLRICNFLSKSK